MALPASTSWVRGGQFKQRVWPEAWSWPMASTGGHSSQLERKEAFALRLMLLESAHHGHPLISAWFSLPPTHLTDDHEIVPHQVLASEFFLQPHLLSHSSEEFGAQVMAKWLAIIYSIMFSGLEAAVCNSLRLECPVSAWKMPCTAFRTLKGSFCSAKTTAGSSLLKFNRKQWSSEHSVDATVGLWILLLTIRNSHMANTALPGVLLNFSTLLSASEAALSKSIYLSETHFPHL